MLIVAKIKLQILLNPNMYESIVVATFSSDSDGTCTFHEGDHKALQGCNHRLFSLVINYYFLIVLSIKWQKVVKHSNPEANVTYFMSLFILTNSLKSKDLVYCEIRQRKVLNPKI